jgi:hemerythrin superfamily protein
VAKTAARKTPRAKSVKPAEPIDAITLLKSDHRTVDALFDEFDKARRSDTKARLVAQICTELKIHTIIEEELFYPAVRPKIDPDIVDEGVVEHDGAKVLINDLSAAKPTDPYYDSKVKVLAEEIRHHVQEEEKWLRGMFAQARRSDIDMEELGARLGARKAELQGQAKDGKLPIAKLTAVKLKA